MEEIFFIILQIVISISVVAGVLVWLLRGLVCRSHHEPTGKAVLITGCDTGIGLSVYTATKHALEGFSQVIRLELAKFGVQVVSIQPGDFSKATNLLNNHHKNMNLMWGEMTDINREEYKQFFLAYHDTVAKSGFTGHGIKPISVLPQSLLAGFEVAVLSKVAQHNYRIMPAFSSNIKMIIMDLLPSSLVQSFIMRRYTKSIPPLSFKYENYKSTINL